jgi:hypothetical protein
MAEIFDKLLREGAKEGYFPARTEEAREWFREQSQDVIVRDQRRVIRNNPIVTSRTITGFLYLFHYKAQTKTIPYYDRFPVVFPFRRTRDGFYGINLHYLPFEFRAILMDNLYDLALDDNYDEETRLRMSYSILDSAGKFRFFRPCIKHYINSNVQSRFALIPANQWDIALFLPLSRFVKPSGGNHPTVAVYRDSIRKIRRGK